MAKEMIMFAGKEVLDHTIQANIKTMSVPVSSEMVPAFTMVVYHYGQNDEIVSDSIIVPVNKFSQHKVLQWFIYLWIGNLEFSFWAYMNNCIFKNKYINFLQFHYYIREKN